MITELAEKDLENETKVQIDELDISAHHLVITYAVKQTKTGTSARFCQDFAKLSLSPNSNPNWAEMAIFPADPATHPPTTHEARWI